MLRLTLVRHARAEPARSQQQDRDRELDARGKREAVQAGQRLLSHGLTPGRILSSPALRAATTATIIARELQIASDAILPDERLYLAAPTELMQVVQELGGAAVHLMVVGHNPGISEFADQLSAHRRVDNLPTCACYTLQFDAAAAWPDLDWATGSNAELDVPG